MPFNPDVSVSLDLSTNSISFAAPTQASNTGVTLFATLSKTQFFAGTQANLDVFVTKDVSGAVTDVGGRSRDNVNKTHMKTTIDASMSSSWLNNTTNALPLTLDYNSTGASTFVFDIGNAVTLNGTASASLGTWITCILWHALQIRKPTSKPLFPNLATLVSTINNQITNSVAAALQTEACQTGLVRKILEANGPVFPTVGGVVAYDSKWTDLDIILTINSLTMNCAFTAGTKKLVLNNIPVRFRLT